MTTRTVYRNSGVNSFSKFDVDAGNTVNLHVPDGASNLVNMVFDQKSHIEGMLNSYKNGKIDGNIYFLNPHGVVVGREGRINVGTFHLMTPTPESMESFFSPDGTLQGRAMDQLMEGEIPISSSGVITVRGRVRGRGDVSLQGGDLIIGDSPGVFKLSDVVNTGGLEPASHAVVESDGTVKLLAESDITVNSDQSMGGHNYVLSASDSITVAANTTISTRNVGAATDQENASSTGNSGNIELSAPEIDLEAGAKLLAHATNGHRAGDVTLRAVSDTDASIQMESAQIRGDDISLLARANTNLTLQGSNPVSNALAEIFLNTGANIQSSGDVTIRAEAAQEIPTVANNLFDARDAVARLTVDGASVTADGNISLSSDTVVATDLGTWLDNLDGQLSGWGMPLSFLVASTDSKAETTVQGASQISAGGDVVVTSNAETQSTIAAVATFGLVAATSAISDVENKADTQIKGTTSMTSGGGTTVAARGKAIVSNTADANAVGGSGGALSIAIGHLDSDTRAKVSEGATIASGGALDVHADTINQSQSAGRAGVTETQSFIKDQISEVLDRLPDHPIPRNIIDTVLDKILDKVFEKLSGDDDEDDASAQIAGSFGLNIVNNDTEASITSNADKTVSSSELMSVRGRSVTHAISLASGMSEGGTIGGGAGLAIQSVDNRNRAFAEGQNSSTLTINAGGEGMAIEALTESYDEDVSEENNNDFSALGYSGPGGRRYRGRRGLGGQLGQRKQSRGLVGRQQYCGCGRGRFKSHRPQREQHLGRGRRTGGCGCGGRSF